ncbi:hypothetical protein EZS27_024499 [termite gut metagenome]|uniref:Uncharacterized protein n=1 Tax=termite gut metagenome TaxID=433724 RepID=A0A5J4QYK0_9ZZZZ
MENQIKNLWPKIEIDGFSVSVPKDILLRQADYLGESTKNILTARVASGVLPPIHNPDEEQKEGYNVSYIDDEGQDEDNQPAESRIKLRFIVSAPMLNYQFELLSVIHSMITPYPAKLICNIISKHYRIEEKEKFVQVLEEIFNTEKVQNILKTLIAQSQ